MTDTAHRQTAQKRGQFSESIAAFYLRLKGYRILERGFRVPVGEIDIIARRGNLIAFVEVKARNHQSDAASAISANQRSRIRRASMVYGQQNPDFASCDLRFDAVLITPGRWPVHVINAW
jgi:putative endonuclease